MQNLQNKKLIIFDDACILCLASVNFIVKNDHKNQFLYTSFQSDAAKNSLLHFNINKFSRNSILLIENGKLFKKSNAALNVAKHLPLYIKWIYIFVLVPKKWRDVLYDLLPNIAILFLEKILLVK